MSLLASHPFPVFVRDLAHRQVVHALMDSLHTHNGLNGNVLLFCIWFALTEQGRLRRPEFRKIENALHPWHERISVALHQLANSLHHFRDLRQWVRAEADCANQFEQQLLAQALPIIKKSRRNYNQRLLDAGHNLITYYKVMRVSVNDEIRTDTLKFLHLLFNESTEEQILRSIQEAVSAARMDDSGFTQITLEPVQNLLGWP